MSTTAGTVTAPRSDSTTSASGPHRRTATLVGVLFLASTTAFATGDTLINAYFDDRISTVNGLIGGVALQVLCGVAVLCIGWALLPVLSPRDPSNARRYLQLRAAECVAIIGIGLYLLAKRTAWDDAVLVVYIFSALAGLALCTALLRSDLVVGWMARLGLVGYLALLLGVISDLTGVVDITSDAGMAFLAPGGLFEVIFPISLIARGFRSEGVLPESIADHPTPPPSVAIPSQP